MPAKGDGITKRKDGLFMARYTVQTSDGPKRKTIYGRKYGAVQKKLAEARGDAARGIVFDTKGQTVGEFLERWLEDVVRPNKTHRTYSTHRQQIRSHLIPALGRIKLDALRKAHVDTLYSDLLRPKPQGRGLAPSSVRRVHAVLHAALEEAVRGDLIPRNPAAHANKPKVRQEEIEPLDAEQAGRLLDATKKTVRPHSDHANHTARWRLITLTPYSVSPRRWGATTARRGLAASSLLPRLRGRC